jgi:periplasmic divalent cation tolerance protein
MSLVSVYAVFADTEEAERIGRALIEERLAACINILGPCRSIYRWQGRTEEAQEVSAILKTSSERVDALIAKIEEAHSYDVPCITVWPVDRALERYGEWVESSVAD